MQDSSRFGFRTNPWSSKFPQGSGQLPAARPKPAVASPDRRQQIRHDRRARKMDDRVR